MVIANREHKELSPEIAVLQMLMKIEKKEGAKSEQHKKIKAKYIQHSAC
jgi:hypothetical protein